MGHSQDLLLLRVPTVSELAGKLTAETGKDREVTSEVGTTPSAGVISRVRPQNVAAEGEGAFFWKDEKDLSLLGKGKTASAAKSFRVNLEIRQGAGPRERSENTSLSGGKGAESCTGKTSIGWAWLNVPALGMGALLWGLFTGTVAVQGFSALCKVLS